MKRNPQSKAGPSSRQRKTAECLEAKFERNVHPHTAPASTDLQAWAEAARQPLGPTSHDSHRLCTKRNCEWY